MATVAGPWRELSPLYLDAYKAIQAMQLDLQEKKEGHDRGIDRGLKREIARAINLVLNTLSATAESVRVKIGEMRELLQRADARDPLTGRYARRIFAKKCLSQIDRLQLHSDTVAPVFPLARVVRELCVFDHLAARVFQATLARVCPYTIPAYLPKEGGARRQVGASIESDVAFFNRMEGYTVFYLAVCQFYVRSDGRELPPQLFGLEQAWAWFARLLNTTPARISPVVLRGGLKAAGFQLHRAFGRQFDKLLAVAYQDYAPLLERTRDPLIPEISNVKTMIEGAIKNQGFQRPEGYL